MITETQTQTITVNTESLLSAIDGYTNNQTNQPWQYFNGFYCTSFVNREEINLANLYAGYDEYLKLSELEDTDENYISYVKAMKDFLQSCLLTSIVSEEYNEDGTMYYKTIDVIYI